MTLADPMPGDAAGQWLDASVRQRIVELAIAGAHHGMRTEARVILRALPSLVTDRETRQWLHIALLIALDDTCAARVYLADARAAGCEGDASADMLARWLDAMDARQSVAPAHASPLSSPSVPPSPTFLS